MSSFSVPSIVTSLDHRFVLFLIFSAVARQLLISPPEQLLDMTGLPIDFGIERPTDSTPEKKPVENSSRLCVLVFEPLIGDYKSSVSFSPPSCCMRLDHLKISVTILLR